MSLVIFTLFHVHLVNGVYAANVWNIIEVDGQQIEQRRWAGRWQPEMGTGQARASEMPLGSDAHRAAKREALRKAHAMNNKYLAFVVNRYRRGRSLTTKAEMDAWRKQAMSVGREPTRDSQPDLFKGAA